MSLELLETELPSNITIISHLEVVSICLLPVKLFINRQRTGGKLSKVVFYFLLTFYFSTDPHGCFSHLRMEFTLDGFRLFIPPTPTTSHFIMVVDINSIFYDIECPASNTTSWTDLRLRAVKDPAILFPPAQRTIHQHDKTASATALLVSIESRNGDVFTGTKTGVVHVRETPHRLMTWERWQRWKAPRSRGR